MSAEGGGPSAGVFIGAGVGGAALVVGVIAVVIYCYMKARKEKSNTNMTKSSDVFHTVSSSDYPKRSRVNQYPDPVAKRNSRKKEREANHDVGHVNPAYNRHGSETDSNSSDMDNRDISPPRVRRGRGGHDNMAFSSDSSYDDESSSVDEDKVNGSYSVEDETFQKNRRRSFQKAKEQDIIDGRRSDRKDRSDGRYTRTGEERRSRRDDFKPRNPRSDSPLTVETLSKHEKITSRDSDNKRSETSKKDKSKRREPSPSVDSSATQTGSLVTEGTEYTATTVSSGRRFAKNPSLRRNSPSRSSSQRRYRKDNKDSAGRTRHHRTHSGERRSHSGENRDRSRSPGGSSRSRRSHSSESRSDSRKINKQQAILPIFADPKAKKKKTSVV